MNWQQRYKVLVHFRSKYFSVGYCFCDINNVKLPKELKPNSPQKMSSLFKSHTNNCVNWKAVICDLLKRIAKCFFILGNVIEGMWKQCSNYNRQCEWVQQFVVVSRYKLDDFLVKKIAVVYLREKIVIITSFVDHFN